MPDVIHVEFDWHNEFGLCDECGDLPAAYWAPGVVFTHYALDGTSQVVKGQNLCPICAALWASYGEALERLWKDDDETDEEFEARSASYTDAEFEAQFGRPRDEYDPPEGGWTRPVDREKVEAYKAEMLSEQRIRVYRRDAEIMGYHPGRRWMVANVPEEHGRESCWPSWEAAMHWATMPSEKRAEIIEIEALMDGGW